MRQYPTPKRLTPTLVIGADVRCPCFTVADTLLVSACIVVGRKMNYREPLQNSQFELPFVLV
jgi:hypothetical protein